MPKTEVRPERDWAGLHYLLDSCAGIAAKRLRKDQAEHDALLIDDHAHVPAGLPRAVPHSSQTIADSARWDVLSGDIGDAWRPGFLALAG